MKALEILNNDNIFDERYLSENRYLKDDIRKAIEELEELQNNISTVIEEIDYALAKPDYAKNYLGNAKRFLMEI